VYKHLKGEFKEDRVRLFPELCRDRFKGNRQRLKHEGFLLNIRKHFFTLMVTEHWHRLTREILEYSSMEILKSCLDTILGNLLQVALLEKGFRPDDLQRSLPTLTIL